MVRPGASRSRARPRLTAVPCRAVADARAGPRPLCSLDSGPPAPVPFRSGSGNGTGGYGGGTTRARAGSHKSALVHTLTRLLARAGGAWRASAGDQPVATSSRASPPRAHRQGARADRVRSCCIQLWTFTISMWPSRPHGSARALPTSRPRHRARRYRRRGNIHRPVFAWSWSRARAPRRTPRQRPRWHGSPAA